MDKIDLKTQILYDLYPDKEIYVGKYNNIEFTNELLSKQLIEVCGESNVDIKLTKKGRRIPKYNKTYKDYLDFECLPIYNPKKLLIPTAIIVKYIGTKCVKLLNNQYFILISTLIIGTIVAMWICVKLKIIK